jgi:hypothetical protein
MSLSLTTRYEFSETRKVLEEFFKAEEEFPLGSTAASVDSTQNSFRGQLSRILTFFGVGGGGTKYIPLYIEYHSVPSSTSGIGTPHPLFRKRVCAPPP